VHLSDIPPKSGKKPSIEVRRFAGAAEHREKIAHVRVAHLTDLHFGRVTPARVQHAAVELTNAEKPDLVVITGDLVCHSQLYLDQLVETLSRIEAPTLAVLGNHDHWSGADEVSRALKRAGIELLRNQNTTLTLRGEKLQIVGLDDAYTAHADRERAVKGLSPGLPSLGLSHIAEEADWLWQAGVPLVFSGHTHAGQVTLAKLNELALGRIGGHRYIHGLYGSRLRTNGGPRGAVYVGAGIGASVMPLRLGERGRSEIAIFELGRDAPAHEEHHAEQPALPGKRPPPDLVEKRRRAVEQKMFKRELRAARAYLDVLKRAGKEPES
jgi:predicted MPP superfamily phosphohydrolase